MPLARSFNGLCSETYLSILVEDWWLLENAQTASASREEIEELPFKLVSRTSKVRLE